MIALNSATAAELDEIPRMEGHGFEIVRYRESEVVSTMWGKSERYRALQVSGKAKRRSYL